jgi:ceramide glucosyltransferase
MLELSAELVLIGSGVALVVLAVVVFALLLRSVRSMASAELPSLGSHPPLTVIRPIKGLDPEAEENIEAAFDHGYPGEVEILFVFDDEEEPAVPIVEQAIRRRRSRGEDVKAKILFCGPPPPSRTGKLNAMIAGLEETDTELVAFADSDIRPRPGALTALVRTLAKHPDAGSAFAPVVASQRAQTIGDACYALLLNGLYSPSAAALARIEAGDMPFIMGQYMVLKRQAIRDIGGLESAEGQLVDDMYLGARVHAAGYKNMVSPVSASIVAEGVSTREFVGIFRRWMSFARSGLPQWRFHAVVWIVGVVFWLGLINALLGVWIGSWRGVAANLGAALLVASFINVVHHRIGGYPLPWRYWWVSFALLVLTPFAFFSTRMWKTVDWRGRSYRVNSHSTLEVSELAETEVEKEKSPGS